MSDVSEVPPRQSWAIALASVGAVLAVAVIALAVWIAVPPSVANINSTVSDGATPVELDAADGASVLVPLDWIVVREGDAAFIARTPDGVLDARVELTAEAANAVIAAVADAASAARAETLASGLAVTHVDTGTGGVVAAVGLGAGTATGPSVVVTAAVGDDHAMADYRPALAQLLEGIRP